jgi:hypothetical protein
MIFNTVLLFSTVAISALSSVAVPINPTYDQGLSLVQRDAFEPVLILVSRETPDEDLVARDYFEIEERDVDDIHFTREELDELERRGFGKIFKKIAKVGRL